MTGIGPEMHWEEIQQVSAQVQKDLDAAGCLKHEDYEYVGLVIIFGNFIKIS